VHLPPWLGLALLLSPSLVYCSEQTKERDVEVI